jgi:hypothetical protein
LRHGELTTLRKKATNDHPVLNTKICTIDKLQSLARRQFESLKFLYLKMCMSSSLMSTERGGEQTQQVLDFAIPGQ